MEIRSSTSIKLRDTVNDKERDEILLRLVKITEVHEKLINGDPELGIIGLREKQDADLRAQEKILFEVKELENKVEKKFMQLSEMILTIDEWKKGLQDLFGKYTSWKFWIKVSIFLSLVYILATEGLPGLIEWISHKITL